MNTRIVNRNVYEFRPENETSLFNYWNHLIYYSYLYIYKENRTFDSKAFAK